MAEFINTIDALGEDVVIDSIIERSVTEFKDNVITTLGSNAFCNCTVLVTVDLPNAVTIMANAFSGCTALESIRLPEFTSAAKNAHSDMFNGLGSLKNVNMPKLQFMSNAMFASCNALTEISLPNADVTPAGGGVSYGSGAFQNCPNLVSVHLPKLSSVPNYFFYAAKKLNYVSLPEVKSIAMRAFESCSSLRKLSFPRLTSIYGYTEFAGCSSLNALVLGNTDGVVALGNTNSFRDTPIAKGTGYIYVPRAFVDSYKAATNWSTYAAQFRALEDYTVDGTVTGELDETKI